MDFVLTTREILARKGPSACVELSIPGGEEDFREFLREFGDKDDTEAAEGESWADLDLVLLEVSNLSVAWENQENAWREKGMSECPIAYWLKSEGDTWTALSEIVEFVEEDGQDMSVEIIGALGLRQCTDFSDFKRMFGRAFIREDAESMVLELVEVPSNLRPYIDWERMAHDYFGDLQGYHDIGSEENFRFLCLPER